MLVLISTMTNKVNNKFHSSIPSAEFPNLKAYGQIKVSISSEVVTLTVKDDEPLDDGSMSPLRKTMFVVSILVSILSCCIFLWAIPCDMATCTPPEETFR